MPVFILREKSLDRLAASNGWEKVEVTPNTNFMVSYIRDECRLNFWLTTGSVGSYLYHPKKRRTQLFRRDITAKEAKEIFINPRVHTGIGYHEKKELEVRAKRRRENAMSEDEEEENRPLKKSKISCRFGINCQRDDCIFEHRCRYGFLCERKDCMYDHSDNDTAWWYDQVCRYGALCARSDCVFQHPNGKASIVCKYGDYCNREGCWYIHHAQDLAL